MKKIKCGECYNKQKVILYHNHFVCGCIVDNNCPHRNEVNE